MENKKSVLVKALAYNDEVRIYVEDTTSLVKDAQSKHQTVRTTTAAFGRLLTGTSILGASLIKNDDSLSVNVISDGELKQMLVTTDSKGNVRGYVSNPKADVSHKYKGKLDVSKLIGQGTMTVVKSQDLKENYTGQVPLQTGEIAEDLTYYLAVSEQIPSSLALGVLVENEQVIASGGFLVQVMPNASDETISKIEEILKKIDPVSTMLEQNHDVYKILDTLTNSDYRILEESEIGFICKCGKDKYFEAISTLPKDELEEFKSDENDLEVVCEFCRKKYYFSNDEIQQIIDNR